MKLEQIQSTLKNRIESYELRLKNNFKTTFTEKNQHQANVCLLALLNGECDKEGITAKWEKLS